MKRDKRNYAFYLEDILRSMQRIVEYTSEMDYPGFRKNYLVVDAVVRNFEIEASNTYLPVFRRNIPRYHGKKCMVSEI